jgi:hypothetical protein
MVVEEHPPIVDNIGSVVSISGGAVEPGTGLERKNEANGMGEIEHPDSNELLVKAALAQIDAPEEAEKEKADKMDVGSNGKEKKEVSADDESDSDSDIDDWGDADGPAVEGKMTRKMAGFMEEKDPMEGWEEDEVRDEQQRQLAKIERNADKDGEESVFEPALVLQKQKRQREMTEKEVIWYYWMLLAERAEKKFRWRRVRRLAEIVSLLNGADKEVIIMEGNEDDMRSDKDGFFTPDKMGMERHLKEYVYRMPPCSVRNGVGKGWRANGWRKFFAAGAPFLAYLIGFTTQLSANKGNPGDLVPSASVCA